MIHTVRRGESLSVIASHYGSSVSAIRQANGLRGSLIRPGQELVVPRFDTPMRTARNQPRRSSEDGSYVVQTNDTLWDISRAFSVSLNDLCSVNGLSKNSVIRPGQRLSLPSGAAPVRVSAPVTTSTYTVRKGDTLYDIANRSGTSVEGLRRTNGISGSRIHPGKVLRIPDSKPVNPPDRTVSVGTTYRVRKGDTLYDIARRFGTSISALRRANGLRSSRIYPGDVLQIPSSEAKG